MPGNKAEAVAVSPLPSSAAEEAEDVEDNVHQEKQKENVSVVADLSGSQFADTAAGSQVSKNVESAS